MNNEWESLKEALRKGQKAEAAQAFSDYIKAKGSEASKPMLVNLSMGKGYPNSIPVEDIPNQLATNPEFFNLMKKVVR